ncbi:MAG: hypothetical protein RJB32_333, partial [Actinomycetota bacterium]
LFADAYGSALIALPSLGKLGLQGENDVELMVRGAAEMRGLTLGEFNTRFIFKRLSSQSHTSHSFCHVSGQQDSGSSDSLAAAIPSYLPEFDLVHTIRDDA